MSRSLRINEQVKLNVKYHHAKFDIYYIYEVWQNPDFKVFDMPRHLTNQKHVSYLLWTDNRVAQFILCMIFLMYVATIQYLNYSRQKSKQESKKHNLHFTFLTYLWPWNKVMSSNLKWKHRPQSRLWSCKVWKILLQQSLRKKATLKAVSYTHLTLPTKLIV